ncbi:hypothetical protein WA158_005520 [Blastocystis sp. Blastoise]
MVDPTVSNKVLITKLSSFVDVFFQKKLAEINKLRDSVISSIGQPDENMLQLKNEFIQIIDSLKSSFTDMFDTLLENKHELVDSDYLNMNKYLNIGTFIFQEETHKFQIEESVLMKFPTSLFTEYYQNEDILNDDGTIFIDHSEEYFPIILEYMKTNKLDFGSYSTGIQYHIYYDLVFYNLPIPSSILKYNLIEKVQNEWNKPLFNFKINKRRYLIKRSLLERYKIHDSYFQQVTPQDCYYDYDSNTFIRKDPVRYFEYIYQYITEGDIRLTEKDSSPETLKLIQTDFSSFSITPLQYIWTKYLTDTLSKFPDTCLLNEKCRRCLIKWCGNDKQWRLLYRASRDGYKASDFHSRCDSRGETIVVICSEDLEKKECLFGGYNNTSWDSTNTFLYDNESFLFTLINPHHTRPTRFACRNPYKALYGDSHCGPVYGCGDLHIADKCNRTIGGWTHLDGTLSYCNSTEYKKSLFVNTAAVDQRNDFFVKDIEVFGR